MSSGQYVNNNASSVGLGNNLFNTVKQSSAAGDDFSNINIFDGLSVSESSATPSIPASEVDIYCQLSDAGSRRTHYSKETQELMNRTFNHSTRMGQIAQQYLNDNIVEVDISNREYKQLSPETKAIVDRYSQMRFRSISSRDPGWSWCAISMNQIGKEAGILPQSSTLTTVEEFVRTSKKDGSWSGVSENNGTVQRYNQRISEIRESSQSWKEGDFICWKSQKLAVGTNNNGEAVKVTPAGKASHIGMIEHVDYEKGIVYTIEGNAEDSPNRKQTAKSDGFIRKQYTFDELAQFGFSGVISNAQAHNEVICYNNGK